MKGLLLVFAAGCVIGCGGDQIGTGAIFLQASPNHVHLGEGTTLSWTSKIGCTFQSSNFGASSASGAIGIVPGSTTTYQITVNCLGEGSTTGYATVSVN
jgi:hypothetical protein